MCQAVQDMINKEKEASFMKDYAKGRANERTSIVFYMFNLKTPIETIALMVNDSVENVICMLASVGIFQTQLGNIVELMEYSKSDGVVMKQNAAFHDRNYESLATFDKDAESQMGSNKDVRINMCQAVPDMVNKEKKASFIEGFIEGLIKGRAEGRVNERTSIVVNMFNLKIPIETIALMVNDSVENVKYMLALAGITVQ